MNDKQIYKNNKITYSSKRLLEKGLSWARKYIEIYFLTLYLYLSMNIELHWMEQMSSRVVGFLNEIVNQHEFDGNIENSNNRNLLSKSCCLTISSTINPK